MPSQPTKTLTLALICLFVATALTGCVAVFDKLPHKKWGFIDKTGTLVIPAKFDDVARDQYGGFDEFQRPFRNFNDGLCAVRVGNRWGYIDRTGAFVVQPQYDNAGSFSEGLACVRLGTRCGFIDKTGKTAIPLDFEFPAQGEQFHNDNPDWDFTQSLIEPMVFSDGLACVQKGNKKGYIDRSGQFIIQPQFQHARPFRDGFAFAYKPQAQRQHIIDKTGNPVGEGDFTAFSEGLFLVRKSGGKAFYAKADGSNEFGQEFADARIFSEGMAAVAPSFSSANENRAYGYIDKTGALVIPCQFDVSGNNFAANFRSGRAIVTRMEMDLMGNYRNLHGIIDKTGHWVVQPSYDSISAYSEGLARAFIDNRVVYLNMDGKVALDPHTLWGNSFSDGLAAVMQ